MSPSVGFFTVFRKDPQHYLHATLLAADIHRAMPGVPVIQLTDEKTPPVPRVDEVHRSLGGPLLERRLEHYARLPGEWILLDTDFSVQKSVLHVFDDTVFDVALCDRNWSNLPQPVDVLHSMPFNTGVAFTRCPQFWTDVLAEWRSYPDEQKDWLSEQRAVASVVRRGHYRVKILPGSVYNYPPSNQHDVPDTAMILHFKGPRKTWLTQRAYACV